jgi:hypothetical protein
MSRKLGGAVALAVLAAVTAGAAQSSSPSQYRPVIDKYCVTCHSDQLRTAGLSLQMLDVTRPGDAADTWEKVIGKLRSGTMPPDGMPRPAPDVAATIVAHLEASLDRAAGLRPNPAGPCSGA